ncbi:hypothetical protein J6590_044155 [Homalodisca vitripennis]|nr:hypothetical protein J6590_044155 [Homalodisca vitripennis]
MFDGEGLAVCDKVKTLGVALDCDRTFSDHVTHVSQRCSWQGHSYLSERVLYQEEVSERITQQNRNHFPKVKLEIARKGFSYFAPQLFNNLLLNKYKAIDKRARSGADVRVLMLGAQGLEQLAALECDVMGQSLSSDLDSVDNLPDELFRQARHLSEVATLTYEEFQEYLKQLNELSQKCMDSEGKQLVFAVKEGSDASVLWKGMIRIACVKIDPATKNVETYRLLNLNQFLKTKLFLVIC